MVLNNSQSKPDGYFDFYSHLITYVSLFSFLLCPIVMFSQENLTIDLPSVMVPAEFCGTWRSPSTTLVLTFKCNDELLEISNYDTLDGKVYLEEVLSFDKSVLSTSFINFLKILRGRAHRNQKYP